MRVYHVESILLAKHNGEEEGGDNAASHREVCVDDCPDLGIARGQTSIKTRPEQPQEQSAWMETMAFRERRKVGAENYRQYKFFYRTRTG